MMITALVLSGMILLTAWLWLQLAKREVSLPIWSTLDTPELAENALPSVSIVVTVHGDEQGIQRGLQSLVRQDYPHYEVIIVEAAEDHASAGMWDRLQAIKASAEMPVRLIQGERLSHESLLHAAAQRGQEDADSEWLLFTTPTTYHAPVLLSRAMAYTRLQGLGILSLAPRYECRTFWEHVWHAVALQYLDFVMPMVRVGEPQAHRVWASEVFVLVSQEAYAKAGGYKAVEFEVDPPSALMRRVKALGYRVEFVKAMDLLQVRPHTTFRDLWVGWGHGLAKRLGARPVGVSVHAVAIWLWAVLPFAALVPAFSFGFWGLDAVQGWWHVVLAVSAILAVVTILQAHSVLRRVLRQSHLYTATLPLGGLGLGAAMMWSLIRGAHGAGSLAENPSLSKKGGKPSPRR